MEKKIQFGYSDFMPKETNQIFSWLCNDSYVVKRKGELLKEIFIDINNREILEKTAKGTFSVIAECMWNDVLVSISRFNDSERTRVGKDIYKTNLSLSTLVNLNPEVNSIKELLSTFNTLCSNIKTFRDKRLSHRDLETTLNPDIFVMPSIYIKEIDEVLSIIEEILTKIFKHYDNGDISFRIISLREPKQLINILKEYWQNYDSSLKAYQQDLPSDVN